MIDTVATEHLLRQCSPYMVALGLHTPPFHQPPEKDFFYSYPLFSQRLQMLKGLINSEGYLTLVLGEKDSGKTTLVEKLLQEAQNNWHIGRVRCFTSLDEYVLRKRIGKFAGLDNKSGPPSIEAINKQLAVFRSKDIIPVLLIDDVHELHPDAIHTLLRIGLIDNIRQLLRLVFVGEQQINTVLAQMSEHMPRQAVIDKIYVQPFNEPQTIAYIDHLLKQAGLPEKTPLTAACYKYIHQAAHGLPGRINDVTHSLLLYNVMAKNFGPCQVPPAGKRKSNEKPPQKRPNNDGRALEANDPDEGLYRPGWLLKQSPTHFTIQLLSTRKEETIHKLASDSNLIGDGAYYHTYFKGDDWFVLTCGTYATRDLAEEALQSLPGELKGFSPWVRCMHSVHAAIKMGKKFAG